MHRRTWVRWLDSFSDNRKSTIENLKWLGLSVIAFVLVVTWAVARGAAAEESPTDRCTIPGAPEGFTPARRISAEDFGSWATLRGRTSPLNTDSLKPSPNRFPTSLPSWSASKLTSS